MIDRYFDVIRLRRDLRSYHPLIKWEVKLLLGNAYHVTAIVFDKKYEHTYSYHGIPSVHQAITTAVIYICDDYYGGRTLYWWPMRIPTDEERVIAINSIYVKRRFGGV